MKKQKKLSNKIDRNLYRVRQLYNYFNLYCFYNNVSIDTLIEFFNRNLIVDNKVCPITLLNMYYSKSQASYWVKWTLLDILGDIMKVVKNADDFIQFKKTSNIYNRKYRLHKRIEYIFNDSKPFKIFGTLTFNDKYINMKDKKRQIRQFLSKTKCNYVANIDYGNKNEREHYHFVISCDVDQIFYLICYPYGYYYYEQVDLNNDSSSKKICCYIDKLSNHALKDSTLEERVIYSRIRKDYI